MANRTPTILQRERSAPRSSIARAGDWTRRRFIRVASGTVAVVTTGFGAVVGFNPTADAAPLGKAIAGALTATIAAMGVTQGRMTAA